MELAKAVPIRIRAEMHRMFVRKQTEKTLIILLFHKKPDVRMICLCRPLWYCLKFYNI